MKITDAVQNRKKRPVSLAQFGEGNFLRGFLDYMVDIANDKGLTNIGVAVVNPIPASLDVFRQQEGLYNVLLRGKMNGAITEETRLVSCLEEFVNCYDEFDSFLELARGEDLRFIVSNTTEAGIVYDETDKPDLRPPNTYPGKLTVFLYERYKAFSGDAGKGLYILPAELIEKNGRKLEECVMRLCELWQMPEGFVKWLRESCYFCNTLVDRIITGYPKDDAAQICGKLGYEDKLLVSGEPFALYVIECSDVEKLQRELPLDAAGLPVVFTTDYTPYRERKVRILNGAHTSTIMAAYLAGYDIVSEYMADDVMRKFSADLIDKEVIPNIQLSAKELRDFADAVVERFENPFIKHRLMDISLNSTSKWRARVLPSLLDDFKRTGKLPVRLTFSFAAMLVFYRGGSIQGKVMATKNFGREYNISDDMFAMEAFAENSVKPIGEYVRAISVNKEIWGRDLTELEGFVRIVTESIENMDKLGIKGAMEELRNV
ncbi:MAG: tagaturonate reductase [Defluviitaleaceae bacterium]|nr:tagaturonate reductase [Defluviitaleaceae bacterium]